MIDKRGTERAGDAPLGETEVRPSGGYRGTSLIRKHNPLGPCRRPKDPRGGLGSGRFVMSEVPLYSIQFGSLVKFALHYLRVALTN